MSYPLVSIIIPVYNRANLIKETLDSIIAQTYTNWECLVIDDGSTDGIESIIKRYSEKDGRISFFTRPKNRIKGANACRNFGLQICNGQYVNWFDSDDIMRMDKLELQVNILKISQYNFCVCQTMVFSNTIFNTLGLLSNRLISKRAFEDFVTKKIIFLTQAPLFKKDFLIINNFTFDETLQAGQEWELFSRILIHHPVYEVIEQPLVYLRKHENSISGSKTIIEKWNYTLARYNLYKNFKDKLSVKIIKYLNQYFKSVFCELLREDQINKAFFIFKRYIMAEKTNSNKRRIYMMMALVSFSIFKRGEYFLRKV